jgi:ankyrin repeat protein
VVAWHGAGGVELFCACADGNLEIVTRLVDQKPALIRAHYEYQTPLYFAVRENRLAVAMFLIERGAEPFWNGNDLVEIARRTMTPRPPCSVRL